MQQPLEKAIDMLWLNVLMISVTGRETEPGAEVFQSPRFLGALQGTELNRDFLLASDLLRFCQSGQNGTEGRSELRFTSPKQRRRQNNHE